MTKTNQRINSATIAMSRFRVANRLSEQVAIAFAEPSATDLRAIVTARERRSRALSLRLRGACAERALRCRVDVHATHFVLIGEPDSTAEVSFDDDA